MDLINPDLLALARSFDIEAERADDPDQLERILRRNVKWDEPFLVDFRYPLISPPW